MKKNKARQGDREKQWGLLFCREYSSNRVFEQTWSKWGVNLRGHLEDKSMPGLGRSEYRQELQEWQRGRSGYRADREWESRRKWGQRGRRPDSVRLCKDSSCNVNIIICCSSLVLAAPWTIASRMPWVEQRTVHRSEQPGKRWWWLGLKW